MQLDGFTTLTFDMYGTLIDWETGILDTIRRLAPEAQAVPDERILETFARLESALQQAEPAMIYPQLLSRVYQDLTRELSLPVDDERARIFGRSVPDWPPFPDSAPALRRLARRFGIVAISNVDNASIAMSVAKLGVRFDILFTAQEIGSCKPSLGNFEYALRRLGEAGVAKAQILHVAQSLYHDHGPCETLGIPSVWIDRRQGKAGAGATAPPPVIPKVEARFASLGEFASFVEDGGA